MKAKITKEGLCIDISELLDNIAPEDKKELFKHIACDDQVIRDVADQILDGWTEDGWHGTISTEAQANTEYRSTPAINAVRRDFAKRSSEVAKREIQQLEKALESAKKRVQDLENEKYAREDGRTWNLSM
jgi:hypothetical protein